MLETPKTFNTYNMSDNLKDETMDNQQAQIDKIKQVIKEYEGAKRTALNAFFEITEIINKAPETTKGQPTCEECGKEMTSHSEDYCEDCYITLGGWEG